jgi:hypothetical protein
LGKALPFQKLRRCARAFCANLPPARRRLVRIRHEALRRCLVLPGLPATARALKQETTKYVNERDDPRYVEKWGQLVEAMRKAGLPD